MKFFSKVNLLATVVLSAAALSNAQTFPPVTVTGPFPKGTEAKRYDAPVDSLRPASPTIYHEYTCYKVKHPPKIDGDVDSSDSVWSKIPWTPMTFWESQFTDQTLTVFSGESTDTWKGPKDCAGYFKMLWDDMNVYVAIKVYDDAVSTVKDTTDLPQTDCSMYQHDCIQLSFNSTPPRAGLDIAQDPFAGCELGLALATVFPLDSLRDTLDTTQYLYFPDTTKAADTTEAFTSWMPTNANMGMALAPGSNNRSNSSVKGKAMHASIEKKSGQYVTRYEFALRLNDSASGFFWKPFIHDDAVGRLSIMAMDHDGKAVDSLEAVSWASGILTKNFNMFGSVKWSLFTPDGEAFPTGAHASEKTQGSLPARLELRSSGVTASFELREPGAVRVELFDVSGRRVAVPVNQFMTAGAHRIDRPVSGLHAGTYACRLLVGGAETVRSVILVR